jgi:uncharacterized protein (DUF1015 family)
MAEVKPFKAIRYNPSLISDPGAVITPPYDVIGNEEQDALHRKSPYNIIRLEYGKTYPADNDSDNRYTRAAETLNNWLDAGVLKADDKPLYYLYEQSYSYESITYKRRGIVAALGLEPYQSKVVLPHELTMTGPKKDRLQLLSSSRTNISPIFTLFPDPEKRMADFFAQANNDKPLFEAIEDNGQTHRLWTISDPVLQAEFTKYMTNQPLLIADGHHRYETALKYYQDIQDSKTMIPCGAANILTVMVSIHDPGLLMLPTHRLLSGLSSENISALHHVINDQFATIDFGYPHQLDQEQYWQQLVRQSRTKNCFGFITKESASLLIPNDFANADALPVSLLHDHILQPVLSDEAGTEAIKNTLSFSHDFSSSLDSVLSGNADAAFILDTIPIDAVFDRASRGIIMPQKSTYFYPKLPSGIVLHHMELSY